MNQYFTQRLEPFDEFNYDGVKNAQLSNFDNYVFKITRNINKNSAYNIAKLLPEDWFSFLCDNELAWCYPEDEDPDTTEFVQRQLESLGVPIIDVDYVSKQKMIGNIDLQIPEFIIHDSVKQIRFPIDLRKRIIWIAHPVLYKRKAKLDLITKLFSYKYSYEKSWGYNGEIEPAGLSYMKLTHMLFDARSFRGDRMLDINIWNDPIWIVMRFKEGNIQLSNDLAKHALKEFKTVYDDIEKILFENAL